MLRMVCEMQMALELLFWLFMIFPITFTQGYTNVLDVSAINDLHSSLGSPPLPGWVSIGGDPCGDEWQGVTCIDSNISEIRLNGANLGGELGDKLAGFSSIIVISLSNNHIGGTIPEGLPISLQQLYLSDNQFAGSIPSSLSDLTLLTALSLNANYLGGSLPDSFHLLSVLTNVDLSFNNFSTKLPPSMASLSSLTTLHIQNNQLSGTLDVLEDLPLKDLNVENNLFSGPIPPNLLSIPNFKKDGNPFSTSIAPSSAPPPAPISRGSSPPAPLSRGSSGSLPPASESSGASGNYSRPPTGQDNSPPSEKKTKKSTAKIVLIVLGAIIGSIILLIVMFLLVHHFLSQLRERNSEEEKVSAAGRPPTRSEEILAHDGPRTPPSNGIPNNKVEKLQEVAKQEVEKLEGAVVDSMGVIILPPPPIDQIIVNPITPPETEAKMPSPEHFIPKPPPPPNPPTSAVPFSVASLQQFTNSFSEENLVIEGKLGKVYCGDLDDGKQLMVLKLDNGRTRLPEKDFFNLVTSIFELRHPNILELVGYCAEYDQRLLVYNCFGHRTLHDVLHGGDDVRRKLSWKARIQIASGAAKALQYLHEGSKSPVVHQNFESANILLDDELAVRVCGCGLASKVSAVSASQLSGRIHSLSYEAPEVSDSGSYSKHSDVYSFGVVLLELLTGRKPFDSSLPRAEQNLVRWVRSQLYDIDNLSKMVDPAIQGKFPVKSLSRFADVIGQCIRHTPQFRQYMSVVAQDLGRILEELNLGTNQISNPP